MLATWVLTVAFAVTPTEPNDSKRMAAITVASPKESVFIDSPPERLTGQASTGLCRICDATVTSRSRCKSPAATAVLGTPPESHSESNRSLCSSAAVPRLKLGGVSEDLLVRRDSSSRNWDLGATPVLLISLLAGVPIAAKTPTVASAAFATTSIKGNGSGSLTNKWFARAQSPQIAARPKLRLPDEAAGFDGIVRTLISAFDQADIVALGEDHGEKLDSEVRIALLRHPDFAKRVRFVVVEFASTAQQPTLDRYIRGEAVPIAQLQQVWKTTSQSRSGVWDSPIYADFLAAVRDVNRSLPAEARIRVLAGDTPARSGWPATPGLSLF